jgi:ABC-2 type transport system ATP-binding protein
MNSTTNAINITNISKTFLVPHEQKNSVKGIFVDIFSANNKKFEEYKILNNISFEVGKGDFFGIVGRNGSGKSTLLKLLAGIYSPDEGRIDINGTLTPFIELGVGFNGELSGRENVFLNGALLGFSRKETVSMYEEIVEFAELEKFMDQKLKNYSSGMLVRLAFSIAIKAKSDILLLDEVLAVGDAAFQRKCFDYFMSLKKEKRTVILVTHDMGAVRQYCNKAIMIDEGVIIKSGTSEEVAQAYQKFFSKTISENDNKSNNSNRWGSGALRSEKPIIKVKADFIEIHCKYKAQRDIPAPILGFTIYGPAGNNILEGNTERSNIKTADMKAGDVISLVWQIPNILINGKYTVALAACDESKINFYDWYNNANSFSINKEIVTGGLVNPEIRPIGYSISRSKNGKKD